MARAYGYGATMAAWNTDYLAFWAGHDGMVRHAKSDFRTPAFEGDITYLRGRGGRQDREERTGASRSCRSRSRMTNQEGSKVVVSTNEVELPY